MDIRALASALPEQASGSGLRGAGAAARPSWRVTARMDDVDRELRESV
jgi:hypothetical protein